MSFWEHFKPDSYFGIAPSPTLRARVTGVTLMSIHCPCSVNCGAMRIGTVTQLHHHFDSTVDYDGIYTNVVAQLDNISCPGCGCADKSWWPVRLLRRLVPGARPACTDEAYLWGALSIGGAPVNGRIAELTIE